MGEQIPSLRINAALISLLSSLILAIISDDGGGFFFGSVITSVGGAALDPICAGPTGWTYCSPNNFPSSTMQIDVLTNFQYERGVCPTEPRNDGGTKPVYEYASCAEYGSPECNSCFQDASQAMLHQCPNKDGAQYATEHCCVRYETYNYC